MLNEGEEDWDRACDVSFVPWHEGPDWPRVLEFMGVKHVAACEDPMFDFLGCLAV